MPEGQANESEERNEVTVASDVGSPTRRALLTGGAVVAGAAVAEAVRTGAAEAAPVYVQLGAANNTTTGTTITSTTGRAFAGASRAASGIGVQGLVLGNPGTGVWGVANIGGVSIGVKGESTAGYGVRGKGGYNGVYGQGGSYGVIGSAPSGYGVYGTGDTGLYGSGGTYGAQAYGSTYGVYGSSSTNGVYGQGGSYGVYGDGATGVYGTSSAGSGVYGATSHPNAIAVYGSGGQYAVQGTSARTAGVRGDSGYVGVWGEGTSWGFFSIATGTSGQNYGIMSETKSRTTGYAGYFKGNVYIEGSLQKSSGSFTIDHPLDPERKWLRHSFVESPDMMNVYNGNVTTDASGFATVKLPAYFGALNRDFRYQLTVIGTFAQAIVEREIQNNQFRIRTDKGRVKVSWQVTGIRQDDYAKAHPIVVEEAKKGSEAGARLFVPKGSSARQMNVGPTSRPTSGPEPASVPAAPQAGPPPREPPP